MKGNVYNLDIFENLVFRIPSARRIRSALLATSLLSGLLVYGLVQATTGFDGDPLAAAAVVAIFLVAPLCTAFLTGRFPDFPRRWGYSIGLVAVVVGVVFLAAELLVGPVDGWRLLTLGVSAILLTTMATLVLTAGTRQPVLLLLASSPVPAVLVGLPLAGSRWYGLPGLNLGRLSVSLAVVVLGLAASVYIHERLIDANVTYIDGSRLTSTLLTGREEDIDAGYPHEPVVQSLHVSPGAGPDAFSLVTPWVHPGPLVNFGGGAIADTLIDELNRDGDGAGFFAKGPATHEDDPAEGAIADRVQAAIPNPELSDRASRLIHRRYADISFHGRRYGDSRLVLMEPDEFGDFPSSVIGDVIDPSDTVVVDRHVGEPGGDRGIRFGSTRAARIRSAITRFLEDLDDAQLYEYRAGAAVDTDGKQVCALVEAVDDQRTVLLGSNENEVSPTLRAMESELDGSFDEVVPFSTDTHHDLHDLAVREVIESDRLRAAVEAADEAVGPAEAGIDADRAAETRLLGREYYALQYTINYVLRSFTVSLFVLYALVVLIALI